MEVVGGGSAGLDGAKTIYSKVLAAPQGSTSSGDRNTNKYLEFDGTKEPSMFQIYFAKYKIHGFNQEPCLLQVIGLLFSIQHK